LPERAARWIACPICGSFEISAAYREDPVVYLACAHCLAAWPIEVDPSETRAPQVHGRLKSVRDPEAS
jgi:hypothetical protein